ncbi:MAG: S9 family peptidase [Flavobacteriales bacterium]|jgi:dipeptidyl aminopeptidase/acylaminoacyl peptidase|nr:S9 family peptidase [Flavobacteriales bacterium]
MKVLLKHTFILFVLITTSFFQEAKAQKKYPITPEKLWELNRIRYHFSLNEDEGIVTLGTYNVKRNEGQSNIYLLNYKTKELKALTKLSGHVSKVSKTKDDETIGFLYDGQWYELNLDTKRRVNLLNDSKGTKVFKYSPSSTYAVYSKAVKLGKSVRDIHKDLPKADVKIYDDLNYRHWNQWNDEFYDHLVVQSYNSGRLYGEKVDILKKTKFDVPTKPFGGFGDLTWSPDGRKLVYVAKKYTGKKYASSTNTDLYEYDVKSRKTKVLSAENKGYDTHPSFSPNGKYLAWTQMRTPTYESDKNNIVVLKRSKDLLYNLTYNFSETVQDFKWSKDGNNIYFQAPFRGSNHIFKIDVSSTFENPPITKITTGDFNYGLADVLENKLILSRTDFNRATELYQCDLDGGNLKAISKVNEDVYSKILDSKVEKRAVTTSDGKKMLTWVIYPPNFDPNKKYPALLYCQGGPQAMVSQFYSYRWNFQLMAAQGYIVIAPNRRGLPGFGEEWNAAISRDWGGQAMKDYLSAVDDLKKESFVDEDKIGAVGASYGGYSVYMLAGIHQKRFKTFISHCGLFNLESWYGSTEELFFAHWDIGGPYWIDTYKENYQKNSPHKYVQNWDTPMMVIHGGKDYRVPDTQGLEAYQAARMKGLKARLMYFPNEGHWVLGPQNSLLWHREFFKWLEETM